MLWPHDRKGIPTCQAVSLHETRKLSRSPGSDKPSYVNLPSDNRRCSLASLREIVAGVLPAPSGVNNVLLPHAEQDIAQELGWWQIDPDLFRAKPGRMRAE